MSRSKIEWLHRPGTIPEVYNPVTGCTKVSEGCRNCYAETVANRFWAKQYPFIHVATDIDDYIDRPRRFTDVMCHEDRLDITLRWTKPRTVFTNSMSDLFHEAVPEEFIVCVFAKMQQARRHTFIVLTKRPGRMAEVVARIMRPEPPLPNVWLGVSVEDQATADERIPLLLQTPAAVRVVSAEPLLSRVDLTNAFDLEWVPPPPCLGIAATPRVRPDWLIVGGESGPKARPCDVAWIRSLVQQARAADVPCFVKQLGANPRGLPTNGATTNFEAAMASVGAFLRSHKGADPAEWPEDLRVREWPA